MTTWTLRQSPHPRDRRLPTATGPVALVRRALMRWRWRWADGSRGAGSLGAARGRGADPIRVFPRPHRHGEHTPRDVGMARERAHDKTPPRDFLPGLAHPLFEFCFDRR
jgi:hypothetical protein